MVCMLYFPKKRDEKGVKISLIFIGNASKCLTNAVFVSFKTLKCCDTMIYI